MKHCLATVLLTVLTSFSISVSAQKISGKVLRETGTGAGHVSVEFRDKSNKVFTNPDGTFTIMAKKLPDTLVFTSPGFEPYSVVVTEKTVADVNFEIVLLSKREKTSSKKEDVLKNSYRADIAPIERSPGIKFDKDSKLDTMPVWADDDPTKIVKYVVTPHKEGKKGEEYSGSTMGLPRIDFASTSLAVNYRSDKKTVMLDSLPLNDVYKSHLLTAGEINDFNKWKMWEDFQENEFKTWSEHWDLYPRQRYSVQLQNKEHVAIVGQKVFLVNKKTNDTVWAAVTDNTGKAELWAEFDGKKKEGDYFIACKGSQDIVAASFANGVNRIELSEPCSLSNTIDIAFVVDATGSMGDEIEFLKVELEDVIRNTFSKYADLDLNVGSVFYRDRGDEYVTRHIDFQADLLKVLNFIKLQRAAGGGDTPESVNAALRSALDSMSWHEQARGKILFLVLDAPPHDEAKNEMFDLIKRAAAMGIRVVPVVCSGAEKSTEFIMRSIALATNGDYVFLTDDSRVGLPHVKPTTDAFNVELFTNLLQRIITQMVFANKCTGQTTVEIFKTTPPNIEKIKIYPNPTQGNVRIESSNYLKEVFITDFTGKILMRIITNEKERKWNINISAYPNAAYLVKYITTDDRWGATQVVLIH
jgi:hypothetical protein